MTQNFGIKDFFYESIGPQMEKVFNVSFDDLKDEKYFFPFVSLTVDLTLKD